MKHAIFLISILLPLASNAQMYFEDGTKWISDIVSTSTPGHPHSEECITLELTNNTNPEFALGFYLNDSFYDHELIAFVKSEAENVYIHSINETEEEWYLIYNFGLQPGEGDYFYMPRGYPFVGDPIKAYLRCNAIIIDETYGGWDMMRIEEFDDADCESSYGEGYWIKGLSSENGVLNNMYFNAEGSSGKLIAVYKDEEKIYNSTQSDVKQSNIQAIITINGKVTNVPYSEATERGIIYTIDGKLIQKFNVNLNPAIRIHSEGIYILQIGSHSRRIII